MKKTILVVDDFKTSAFVLKSSLTMRGFNAIAVESGANALEELSKQKIALLITDYHMPDMNGLELVAEVKKKIEYNKIPIFIISTDSDINLKNKAKEAGVTAWLKKPFKLEQLLRFVNRAIQPE